MSTAPPPARAPRLAPRHQPGLPPAASARPAGRAPGGTARPAALPGRQAATIRSHRMAAITAATAAGPTPAPRPAVPVVNPSAHVSRRNSLSATP
jgi:hypothetical protein